MEHNSPYRWDLFVFLRVSTINRRTRTSKKPPIWWQPFLWKPPLQGCVVYIQSLDAVSYKLQNLKFKGSMMMILLIKLNVISVIHYSYFSTHFFWGPKKVWGWRKRKAANYIYTCCNPLFVIAKGVSNYTFAAWPTVRDLGLARCVLTPLHCVVLGWDRELIIAKEKGCSEVRCRKLLNMRPVEAKWTAPSIIGSTVATPTNLPAMTSCHPKKKTSGFFSSQYIVGGARVSLFNFCVRVFLIFAIHMQVQRRTNCTFTEACGHWCCSYAQFPRRVFLPRDGSRTHTI